MLKVQMKPKRETGIKVGLSKGKVIFLNWLKSEIPSISAASYKSLGIVWRAPEKTIIIKGKPSQILTKITIVKAVLVEEK